MRVRARLVCHAGALGSTGLRICRASQAQFSASMTDVLNPAQRSSCMSKIRGRDTNPELMLRRLTFRAGLRYRVKTRLPGRPDMVFTVERVAIFVDGCFWHRCPRHSTRPATNAAFWERKLGRNVQRDLEVTRALRREGWLVLRFWEHDVRGRPESLVGRVQQVLLRRRRRKSGR